MIEVRAILPRLLDMMRLRSGPQDLPAGWPLAIGLALAYIAEGFIADRILGDTETAPRSLMAIGVQFLVIATVLNVRGQANRVPQTLSALAGVGLIFGLFSIVLMYQAIPGQDQPLLAWTWFSVFLWSLVIDAHIYRRALSSTMSIGVLVAVLIFACNFFLIQSIFRAS
jgi:hypothetical protein